MNNASYSLFDTDMFHFRLDPDQNLRSAAQNEFDNLRPNAISEMSLVELKRNFIQRLILLGKKISNSQSLEESYARIRNSGGRGAAVMLNQLVMIISKIQYIDVKRWEDTKSIILTHVDSQIEATWMEFKLIVNKVLSEMNCDRAAEEPTDEGGKWKAPIVICRPDNTECGIIEFIRRHESELEELVEKIGSLPEKTKTNELKKIHEIARKAIERGEFPWEGGSCHKVVDFLIGLQSKTCKELVSSNYKEHGPMHEILGYNFREFKMANYRTK